MQWQLLQSRRSENILQRLGWCVPHGLLCVVDGLNAWAASSAAEEQLVADNAEKNVSKILTEVSSDHFIAATGIDTNEACSATTVSEK